MDAVFRKGFQEKIHVRGDGDRLAAGLDRVGDVLQAVAGHDGNDGRIGRQNALLAQLLDAGGTGDARRLAKHTAGAAKQLLRRHDLLVGHIDDQTVGLADGHERLVRIARHANSDGVGQRVLFHGMPRLVLHNGAVKRAAALRLCGDQPRQTVDKTDGVQILQALPQTGDGATIAHGNGNKVRNLPVQLLHEPVRSNR